MQTDASPPRGDLKVHYTYHLVTGCGGDLHAQEGIIESPNHPQRYPNNTECVWQINVNNGYHVDLNFVPPFELEIQEPCSGDFVEVNDFILDFRAKSSKSLHKNLLQVGSG